MTSFKVGDKVRLRKDVKVWWPDGVPRDVVGIIESICDADRDAEVKFPSISFLFSVMLFDLELVEPAATDPRDAEIAALKARVAELESRQSDADRAYYRRLVTAALINRDVPTVLNCADAVFAEVKRREGGAA